MKPGRNFYSSTTVSAVIFSTETVELLSQCKKLAGADFRTRRDAEPWQIHWKLITAHGRAGHVPAGRFLGILTETTCMGFVIEAAYNNLPSASVLDSLTPTAIA